MFTSWFVEAKWSITKHPMLLRSNPDQEKSFISWDMESGSLGRRQEGGKGNNMILWLSLAFRLFSPLPSVVYTVHLWTNLDKCNENTFHVSWIQVWIFLHSAYSCKPTCIYSLICALLGIFLICILKPQSESYISWHTCLIWAAAPYSGIILPGNYMMVLILTHAEVESI